MLAAMDAAPDRIRALPSFQLARASLRAQRLVADALAPTGMRRQHFSVLAALDEGGPASQAELGRALALDRSDLHAIVGELEAAGAIRRARDASDRRRNVVTVTGKGRRTLARLQARVDAAQDELLAGLPARDRAELARLLAALA